MIDSSSFDISCRNDFYLGRQFRQFPGKSASWEMMKRSFLSLLAFFHFFLTENYIFGLAKDES